MQGDLVFNALKHLLNFNLAQSLQLLPLNQSINVVFTIKNELRNYSLIWVLRVPLGKQMVCLNVLAEQFEVTERYVSKVTTQIDLFELLIKSFNRLNMLLQLTKNFTAWSLEHPFHLTTWSAFNRHVNKSDEVLVKPDLSVSQLSSLLNFEINNKLSLLQIVSFVFKLANDVVHVNIIYKLI